MQFETALMEQSVRYGWVRELIKVFRDGFKYNFGAAVVDWKRTPLKTVVTDTNISTAGMAAIREHSYGGNMISRIDPYNCFMDMTVAPANLHTEGELFLIHRKQRTQLRRLNRNLPEPRKTLQMACISTHLKLTNIST